MGAVLLAGCKGPQSMLDPAGPSAGAIAAVWWWMFAVALLVLAGVVVAWFLAMRPRAALDATRARRVERRWLVGGGLVLPTVSVTALLIFGSPAGFHQLPLPGGAAAPLRIEAIGHQWWWEIRYPDGVVLRDELRLPAGRPVDILTKSSDVIHSFWVPALGGKLDAVPGRTLTVRLQGDRVGSYRGQCAEFCGTGHAHMTMMAHVVPAEAFDAWLRAQSGTAAEEGKVP
ncbi:cytochrome c oxidase subunit II [Variovorax sp. UMC13]|uniref:cytochrome c oxidase subunit II n=1 Tax=Variovorax sp. UMC13 TaxID=1862326 RepID=UPI001C7EF309|nr:cytochrome c oxidase subunit II [Variovorax sp. UMC13]